MSHFPTVDFGDSSDSHHMFYIILKNLQEREELKVFLQENGIVATSHYQSLAESEFIKPKYPTKREYPRTKEFSENILRLPFWTKIENDKIDQVIRIINLFDPEFRESSRNRAS